VIENRAAYGNSHCRVGWSLVAIVLFSWVDWMMTDMVSVQRTAASLPRQSATFGAGKTRQHKTDIPQVQEGT
jgi:hypothetical protein